MISKSKFKKTWNLIKNPFMLFCSAKYLIVFSHMRSRSSVMSHVLGSNPEIVGYGELLRSYNSSIDLLKMRVNLNEDTNKKVCNQFLYDKLLHTSHKVANKYLYDKDFKFIFLLREPESTVKSTLNMGIKRNIPEYQSEEFVFNYYIERLKALEEYAKILEGRFFFIESDELVDDTDQTLQDLTSWLGLNTPLSKEYKTFNKTGIPGHGDPLEHIHSGILKRTKPHEINLSPNLLKNAQEAYHHCLSVLQKHSQ